MDRWLSLLAARQPCRSPASSAVSSPQSAERTEHRLRLGGKRTGEGQYRPAAGIAVAGDLPPPPAQHQRVDLVAELDEFRWGQPQPVMTGERRVVPRRHGVLDELLRPVALAVYLDPDGCPDGGLA